MCGGEVGEKEKHDIRAQVARILRDLGDPEPPLRLSDVRKLLSLDLRYYSSSDPGLVTELTHRFKLFARKSLSDVGKHLLTALTKSRLCSFWVPDDSRILMDKTVPERKQRWIEAHEILHSIIPWHRYFLLGDNEQTLDPACRATLELEANYGAGRLLSLQDRLASEARELDFTFKSIKAIAGRYNNSIASTFWRVVEDRDPTQPVFGVISVHPRHQDIGAHEGPDPWRYYIRSEAFRNQFATTEPVTVYELIKKHASSRRTGPVFTAQNVLADVNGQEWIFQLESFSTGHALLTCGYPVRKRECLIELFTGT
jgi:hypothetical protein